jgi:hypothetical protein
MAKVRRVGNWRMTNTQEPWPRQKRRKLMDDQRSRTMGKERRGGNW